MSKRIIGIALLLLILVYAVSVRMVGQNWDDFSYTHPDERFLTLLLLPQIGGSNSHTHDEDNFPSQQLLVLRDRVEVRSPDDILNSTTVYLGAILDSFSAEVTKWLVSEERAMLFDDFRSAQSALLARQVDALIVAADYTPDNAEVISSDNLDSIELQALRCKHRYPATGGSGSYFDTNCSSLNPHNAGHGFYVYGTFPLFLAHFGSEFARAATDAGLPIFDYQGGHLVWRGMSMILDIFTVLLVYLLGTRMHNRWVGLLAAIFYAAAPLAIQKAHFGTVNAASSFLVMLALYFAVAAQQRGNLRSYLLFGITCGAAVASRINLAPLAGVIVLVAFFQAMPVFDSRLSKGERSRILALQFAGLMLAGTGAFLAFRILNPYAFAGPGFFDLGLNGRWLANLSSASHGASGLQDAPPNWQWLARPSFIYPLKDMLLWGMGLSFSLLAWFGWCWAAYRLLRNRKAATDNLVLLIWVGGYFLWMGRLWAMTMRYYLPLYGALAILAAWCLYELYRRAQNRNHPLAITSGFLAVFGAILVGIGGYQAVNGVSDATALTSLAIGAILLVAAVAPGIGRQRPLILGTFAVTFAVVWGLMFSNVYRHQTTLVQSSRFLFERIPGDFAMKIDGTDDTVPLINIAVGNHGADIPGADNPLYRQASRYYEAAPVHIDFTAPASGEITSVFAPHLVDPYDDPDAETLKIRIYRSEQDSPIGEATLQQNLSRDEHILGSRYRIPFAAPVQVEKGVTYRFEVTVGEGSSDVIGSGSIVYTEGDWDNRAVGINICALPDGLTLADDPPSGLVNSRDCRGTQAFYALVNAQDQIMSFPVDNQVKYDDILQSLELGDYLTIASNRFYDTESRNKLRWPLTTLYYEKLFAGELGYELIATFDETFEFGPWRVSDQHLPTYDSPAWLNELEADEAFHVYDHPAVFVFQKSPDFSRDQAEAVLSQASFKQARELIETDEEAQLFGVAYWSSIEADSVPTGLTFTQSEREVQAQGGTWSERFFSDSLVNTNQAVGVVVWYAAIFAFGALAFPLVFSMFPNMADGGYGVSKLVGMLIVAWLAWAISSLKVPLWSQGGIIFSLALMTLLSFLLGYRNRARLISFLRDHWKRLAWMELIAIIAFLIMIAVRLSNPDLWHPFKGGEKPMDFAYLNGVLRSTTFPPIDPWFAGGFINYYYFGYVLLGVPALLLGVVPAFAYNLMIPTVFSLTGMGAFCAAFNILCRWRKTEAGSVKGASSSGRRLGNPWTAGIMALALCVMLGNLDTVRVIGNGLAKLGGYRTPEGLELFLVNEFVAEQDIALTPDVREALAQQAQASALVDNIRYEINNSLTLVGGVMRGIGRAIQGDELPIGSDRWYWGPSRVLAETPGVGGGAITEMPYFTFLYGDLHAHMINMPLILLTVLFLFNELVQVGRERRSQLERFLALALGAMTVGLMQATNTWDWPSMTLFAVIGLSYAWWLRWNKTFRPLPDIRFYGGLIAILAVATGIVTLLTPPITAASGAGNLPLAGITQGLRLLLIACIGLVIAWVALRYLLARASALELAAHIGGFLALNLAFALPYTSWYAATYNSVRLWDGGKTPLWAYFDIHGLFLFLIVSILFWDTAYWLRTTKVKSLLKRQGLVKGSAGGIGIACLLAAVLTLMGYQVALIVLPLVCWIGLLFFRANQSRAMRFTLVLIGLALSMTLGVEIIVIGGDIGRQNTVFKFYIQVWLLLSVAGGIAFACLLSASEQFSRPLKALWFTPCIALISIAALFPIMGTRARSLDRMAPDTPLTLNGLDYMTEAVHYESAPETGLRVEIDLAVDHALIRWLQENVNGSPVIIEGRRRPSEYQWNGRFAITTGLPSVLGWNFHQRQQRTFHPLPRWVEQREKNISQFYNTSDIDIAVDILHHFEVKYIIRSGLEELQSAAEGLAKFDRMVDLGLLSVAHSIDGGTIYQVDDTAVLQYLTERFR